MLGQMSMLAHAALIGWPLVVLFVAAVAPARVAVMFGLMGGWMLLPNAGYDLPGVPDYSKEVATTLSAALGAAVFHPAPLANFRFSALDLPALGICLVPFMSSVTNDLGVYDGLSEMLTAVLVWGVPYLLGRVYFADLMGLNWLVAGVLVSALVYLPLCWWEIRMSPQLHYDLYGFRTRSFALSYRYGGFRPIVFFWTSLPLVFWLSLATVGALFLHWSGAVQKIFQVKLKWWICVLLLTLVLCKQFIAGILLPMALGLSFLVKRSRNYAVLTLLVIVLPSLMSLRATGAWKAEGVLEAAFALSPDRGHSLETRLVNENRLAARALERPIFGWGGHGRSRVRSEDGEDITITDGLWIMVLGSNGLLGLGGVLLFYILAVLGFCRAVPPERWMEKQTAGACVVVLWLLMTLVYIVPNATTNPTLHLSVGALTCLSSALVASGRPIHPSLAPR